MMKILLKYKYSIGWAIIMIALYFFNNTLGHKAYRITVSNIKQMLSFLPAIFILVGLLDVWVPKETIIKLMGEHSGIKGFVIVLLLATVAAGPLYVALSPLLPCC